MAERIQRRRSAGWRMPPGAVYVGRPTRFGNPFPVLAGDRAAAVAKFRAWIATQPGDIAVIREQLTGRDLACWCPLPPTGEPDQCHAAVLLEIANPSSSTTTSTKG